MKGLKFILSISFVPLFATSAMSQFVRLEVEKVDNGGIVPGKTFRVYALMENEGDKIYAVFGLNAKGVDLPLEVKTTTNFFQHPKGGALANKIQRLDVDYYPELAFDSWFTIGREDNYGNVVGAFPPDLNFTTGFENGNSLSTDNGAWYVTPDQFQSAAGPSKRILLMQLTSTGEISGTLNLQGKTMEVFDKQGILVGGGEVIKEDSKTFIAL